MLQRHRAEANQRDAESRRAGIPTHSVGTRKNGRSEPVSRVLSRATISLGRQLPAASSNLPGSGGGPDRPAPEPVPGSFLLDFAPSGVCHAEAVTRSAVRSYRTISPLPRWPKPARRYIFCGTFPILADGGRYPPLRPVEPGLS